MPYYRVDRLSAMDAVVDAALAAEGPALIEVLLDPAQFFAPKLSSKAQPDGTIVSPPIEDMYPFLPREEYAADMISEKQEETAK